MSDLVFITFASVHQAQDARARVLEQSATGRLALGDAVIVTRDGSGHVAFDQRMASAAEGATAGALWGLLIGWTFFLPVAGMALGAATGGLNVGVEDHRIRIAAQALKPGEAGLFLLVRHADGGAIVAKLKDLGGSAISAPFDPAKEAAIKAALAPHITASPASEAGAP